MDENIKKISGLKEMMEEAQRNYKRRFNNKKIKDRT